jgi:hypothetical protein
LFAGNIATTAAAVGAAAIGSATAATAAAALLIAQFLLASPFCSPIREPDLKRRKCFFDYQYGICFNA